MKLSLETIRRAQANDAQSQTLLSEAANKRVFTYIYRLTLDYHLAEDLTQECVLDLIKSLPNLKFAHENLFWSWLYRTALGKVQHHFRLQGNKRLKSKTVVDSEQVAQCTVATDSGINKLIREELRQVILDAMERLKLRHRNILTLRCFDNLSYADIASIMGGSEVQARLLFFRAKLSLQRQLAQRGFKKDHLLSALSIFALVLTHPAEKAAATGATAASLEVGWGTTILGMLTSKAALVALSTATILSLGAGAVLNGSPRRPHYQFEDPYAGVRHLLANEAFHYPVAVTDTVDPQGRGFKALEIDGTSQKVIPVEPADILVGSTEHKSLRLIVPRGYGVDLSFPGPLVDGPGMDLFYFGYSCRPLQLVLFGDGGEHFLLPIRNCLPNCPQHCYCEHLVPYDLADYTIPFTPTKVGVRGVYTWEPHGGIELKAIKARVRVVE